MRNPEYALSDHHTAKFDARFINTPLIATREKLDLDDKLLEIIGAKIARRTKVLPIRRISPTAVAALVTNPLDYQMREPFAASTDMQVEESFVAPASLINSLLNEFSLKNPRSRRPTAPRFIS